MTGYIVRVYPSIFFFFAPLPSAQHEAQQYALRRDVCIPDTTDLPRLEGTRKCGRGPLGPREVLEWPYAAGGAPPPPSDPPPLLSDWANFSPGLQPMKNFLWRKSV